MGFFKFLKQYKNYRYKQEMDFKISSLAIGINSSVNISDDLHVLMLDYDVQDIFKVVESVRELMSFWRLSDAFIFRTTKGHHVFFWYDIMPYNRVRLIVDYAKYVDPLYKYVSRFYDYKTIRVAGKYLFKDIFFVTVIKGVRVPSVVERELGDLKRSEHKSLMNTVINKK